MDLLTRYRALAITILMLISIIASSVTNVNADDHDADSDGYSDEYESDCGSNPDDYWDTPQDSDGDGVCDTLDAFPYDYWYSLDEDSDGIADELDYCHGTILEMNESLYGDGCSNEQMFSIYDDHNIIQESELINPIMSTHQIFLNPASYYSFDRWWRVYLPQGFNIDQYQFNYTINTTQVSATLPLGIRLHSNSGTCDSHTFTATESSGQLQLICDRPNTGGELFIHLYGTGSTGMPSTMNVMMSLAPYSTNQNPPEPFFDENGDGNLGYDSTPWSTVPAEIFQTITGNFNRSNYDHLDYITYNTSLVNVNRLQIYVGRNVVSATSGLSDCKYNYDVFGSMELDCLVTAVNPSISIEDKTHLAKYSTGLFANGTECGLFSSKSYTGINIDSFNLTGVENDWWSGSYIDYSMILSNLEFSETGSDINNTYHLQISMGYSSNESEGSMMSILTFVANSAMMTVNLSSIITEDIYSSFSNGDCIQTELLLLKDDSIINEGIEQWTIDSTLQNVHPIEDSTTGDIGINSNYFISQGAGTVGHLGYGFDITDSFELEIPHGKELKIVLDTNTPIDVEIPSHENCESEYSQVISSNQFTSRFRLPSGSHRIICEVDSSADTMEFSLSHWDWSAENRSLTTSYEFSVSERFQISEYCCDNDADLGKDASKITGIHVEAGSYNGSFIHLTDQLDKYTITVPEQMGLLTFVQGIDLDTFLPTRDGDIQYDLYYNSGDQETEMSISIPNPEDIPYNMQNEYCYYEYNSFPMPGVDYDSDNDGLTDDFEIYVSDTDPYDYDSDDGGENDCLEYKYGRDSQDPSDDIVINPDDYILSDKIDYLISFHLIEVGIPIELIQDSVPSFITTDQTNSISFSEGNISSEMDEWRIDNLPSVFDIGSQVLLVIPLEWSPVNAMEISISQASGSHVSFSIGDDYRFKQTNGWNDIVLSKVVNNGVADHQNLEYNYLEIWGLDGSTVSINTSTVSPFSTEESDDDVLQNGITRYGGLGYGTEGNDVSDEWSYSVPFGSYSIFEFTSDDNLEIIHQFGNQIAREETFSDMVVRCNWQYTETNELDFNDTIIINNYASLGGSYSITHRVYEGECPLYLGAELRFSGQGINQGISSISISQGNSFIIESNTIENSSGFGLRMLNQNGEVIDSTVKVNSATSATTDLSHPLSGDNSSIIVIDIPFDLDDGQYILQMRVGQVTVDELFIWVSSIPYCQITDAYPNSILSPMETPTWLVNSHDNWNGSSVPWEVMVNESWVRDVNGSPMQVGVTSGLATSGLGFKMIETTLSSEMRVGSVVHHHFTCEQEDVARTFQFDSRVSRIDLHLNGPSLFVFDQREPIQDVRYTVSSGLELNGRPVAGVSGHLSLIDDLGFERRNVSFITDGLGRDHVTVSMDGLYSGEYQLELYLDEQWKGKVRISDDIKLLIEDSTQVFIGGEDIRDLILTADLRRDILSGGENIAIDWSTEGQDISSIHWVLYEVDSSGANLIVAANQLDNVVGAKGIISIAIPNDLHPTDDHWVRLVVRGIHGGEVIRYFSIDGLSLLPEMIIDYSPVQPRPGEDVTFSISCDCIGSYLYWTWELNEFQSGYFAEGNGWVAADTASFVVSLPFSLRDEVTMTIYGRDGEGRIFSASETIDLKETVELNVEVPFYANVGESLDVEWEIISDSLTEVDKVVKIEIELYSFESSEILARTVAIENSYSGSTALIIPTDLKPGSYSIHVTTVLSSGNILEQTSLVEVHDPILGLSAMAMTPEVNRWMIGFVAINVIALWVIMIRSSRRRRDIEDDDIEDDDIDEFISQSELLSALPQPSIPLNQQPLTAVQLEIPHEGMFGRFDTITGFEWLEYPAGTENNWYRTRIGEPWTFYDQQNG